MTSSSSDGRASPERVGGAGWERLAGALDPGRLSSAARTFVAALLDRADLPERLAVMALVFRSNGQRDDARLLARAAKALDAGHRIGILTEWLDRREAPLWHFELIQDLPRNEVYRQALEHFVEPGMTVFEIGTGTGILAMLAVRAGARHVYTCERRRDVADAARAIVERNGMADRITVLARDANDLRPGVDVPEPADVFVAELFDDRLLREDVLRLTALARDRFLKPGATLLPRAATAIGQLVSAPAQCGRHHMDSLMGFDLTPFNRFSPLLMRADAGGGEFEALSEPAALVQFDLERGAAVDDAREARLVAIRPGVLDAMMSWLRLDFGAGIVFENRPPRRSCWWPWLHRLPEPRRVEAGDHVSVEILHTPDQLFLIPS